MSEPKIVVIDNLNAVAEAASEAVDRIVADLAGRADWDHMWDGVDVAIQNEVLASWRSLVDDSVRRRLLSPEDLAMLQALYSRSPMSVIEHLKKVREVGSGKFMDQFLVGYGHASIGDCGTTSVFIEGVSMLAAKAIQDWPLYSGQEASTRYMDFSKAVFENPVGSSAGEAIQEAWRRFYIDSSPRVRAHLVERYPRKPDEDEKIYARAIDARCFDVMRAFLPAGAHTNLSWTTNLRQANDKLRWLAGHPDPHIASLGTEILSALTSRYPHSFGQQSLKTSREDGKDEAVRSFVWSTMKYDYFLPPGRPETGSNCVLNLVELDRYAPMLANRPRGAEVPPWLAELGLIQSEFLLDFGSFRDLQRHRAGTVRMPLLTTRYGFEPWYLDELPDDVRRHATVFLAQQEAAIEALGCEPVVAQNYVAMGFRVQCRVTQSLPAFIYRMELRSGKTIHPTLRAVIHKEISWFREKYPHIALHVDMDPDSWTVRRGKQTIEAR